MFNNYKRGFTLAEVLITLGIIGIIAALTLPALITKYQKEQTVTRLKGAYTTLSQAVKLSESENGEIKYWDYSIPPEDFFNSYLKKYIKVSGYVKNKNYIPDISRSQNNIIMLNGSELEVRGYKVSGYYFMELRIDINGEKLPNKFGMDIFSFFLVPSARNIYNTGDGDALHYVPGPGLYPDGYGFERENLLDNAYRGCNSAQVGTHTKGMYCTMLIMMDGWKISDDYTWPK